MDEFKIVIQQSDLCKYVLHDRLKMHFDHILSLCGMESMTDYNYSDKHVSFVITPTLIKIFTDDILLCRYDDYVYQMNRSRPIDIFTEQKHLSDLTQNALKRNIPFGLFIPLIDTIREILNRGKVIKLYKHSLNRISRLHSKRLTNDEIREQCTKLSKDDVTYYEEMKILNDRLCEYRHKIGTNITKHMDEFHHFLDEKDAPHIATEIMKLVTQVTKTDEYACMKDNSFGAFNKSKKGLNNRKNYSSVAFKKAFNKIMNPFMKQYLGYGIYDLDKEAQTVTMIELYTKMTRITCCIVLEYIIE